MKSLPSRFFRLLLLVLALSMIWAAYSWHHDGLRLYSVQTDSMEPTLKVGSLILDKMINSATVKPGEIISYLNQDTGKVITHRIIIADRSKGYVITKGDNLASPDPPVKYNSILGSESAVLTLAGYILDSLRVPLGLIALIYVPVLALAAVEIRRIAFRLQKPYKHPNFS